MDEWRKVLFYKIKKLIMTDYKKKFLDPRWQKKRLEILQRDKFACCRCEDTEETLHIHHKFYIFGKEPWEYDDNVLETLCATCHQEDGWDKDQVNEILRYLLLEGYTYRQLAQYLSGLQPPLDIDKEERVRLGSFMADDIEHLINCREMLKVGSFNPESPF